MSDELKPCPFCGEEPCFVAYGEDAGPFATRFTAECQNDDCIMQSTYVTKTDAAAAWNNRPVEDALRAERDAYRSDAARLADKWNSVPWDALQDLAQYVDNDDDPGRIELWAHEALALARPWLDANAPKEAGNE